MTHDIHSLTALLQTLCSIESVIGHEAEIAGYIEGLLSPLWPCRRIGNNLIFCSESLFSHGPSLTKKPQLWLFGHIDTVARSKAIADRPSPDGVYVEQDRLYGLGSSDMKGGVAVMIALMQAFADPSVRSALPFDLCFVYYAREEGPFLENGLLELLPQDPLKSMIKDRSVQRLALFLEPTSNKAELGCMGTLHAEVDFLGKSAHSAKPWLGENAIHAAGPLLCALAALKPVDRICDGFLYRESISATIAHGGRSRNAIPDVFTLNLNHRFAPGVPIEEAKLRVQDFVTANASHFTLRFTDLCPSAPCFLNEPAVRQLIDALSLQTKAKQAWTDVARLAELGVPAINFGPGDPEEAHRPGESIDLFALEESYKLLEAYIQGNKAIF